ARYGRVGDVYIPKKVDKWGRHFGFVKFREVKEIGELNQDLEDVWIGSFKLQVNRSRFDRNEESRKKEEPFSLKARTEEGGGMQAGCSFRTALLNSTVMQVVSGNDVEDMEEVLKVEVVSGEGVEQFCFQGEQIDDQERSWVESSKFPGDATEVDGGVVGGSVEEGNDEAWVDFQGCQLPTHGGRTQCEGDGDVSLEEEGKSQNITLLSASILEVEKGNEVQNETRGGDFDESEEVLVGPLLKSGSNDEKVAERTSVIVEGEDTVMATCQKGGLVTLSSGPEGEHSNGIKNHFLAVVGETNRVRLKTRSISLPPIRVCEQVFSPGRTKDIGLDFSDTISLFEVTGGAFTNLEREVEKQNQTTVSLRPLQRGRSRKAVARSKNALAPKFLQVA
ncbi:RNA recognition motif, partial [Trifolium medium]|nr:RNA recognition motif [Trifolium medium]